MMSVRDARAAECGDLIVQSLLQHVGEEAGVAATVLPMNALSPLASWLQRNHDGAAISRVILRLLMIAADNEIAR